MFQGFMIYIHSRHAHFSTDLTTLIVFVNNTVVYFKGFEKPSAIQQRAIQPIIKGRDVIAQLVGLLCLFTRVFYHV